METHEHSAAAPRWNEALAHMEQALRILDESGAPPVIGSHLDLAVSRLKGLVRARSLAIPIDRLGDQIERLLSIAGTPAPLGEAWRSKPGNPDCLW